MPVKRSDLEKLSQKAHYFQSLGIGFDEENTKTCFVMPFFLALGHDVFNPLEFMCEFVLDCRQNGNEKVDYAMCINHIPRVIIEVKRKDAPLKRSIGQLKRYFNADVNVRYAILTNGIDYYFFSDHVHPNLMDDHPHHMLNLHNLTKDDYSFLKRFAKEQIWEEFSVPVQERW